MQKTTFTKRNYFEFIIDGFFFVMELFPSQNRISLRADIFSEKDFLPEEVKCFIEENFENGKKEKSLFSSTLFIDEKRCAIVYQKEIPLNSYSHPLNYLIEQFLNRCRYFAKICKELASQEELLL